MRLKYRTYNDRSTFLLLVKAANTKEIVEFEKGEQCTVEIEDLDLIQKENLIKRIEEIGIASITVLTLAEQHPPIIQNYGFFNYTEYKKSSFSVYAPNLQLLLQDCSRVSLSLTISPAPLDLTFPLTINEEDEFIKNEGHIKEGVFCTII